MEVSRRFSKKRQAIYDALLHSSNHPTAEMVYQQLKAEFPDLSLGTVYRNLKGMVEEGEAICVGQVDGKDRYDAHIHLHAHLKCKGCNTVVDLPISPALKQACQALAREYGVEMDLHSLSLQGLCSQCKTNQ